MDEIVVMIETAKSGPASSQNNGTVDAFNGRLEPAIAKSCLKCNRKCHTSPGCGMSHLKSEEDGSVWLEPRSAAATQTRLHTEKDVVEGKLTSLRGQQTADSCIDLDLRISFTEAYLQTIEAKLTALKLWFASPLVCLM